MSNLLHVATRKGLFTIQRSAAGNGTWEIVDVAFLGFPVTMTLVDRRSGYHYAALDHGHFGVHLHRRRDGQGEWEEIAAPRFPDGGVVPQWMPTPEDFESGQPPMPPENPPTKPATLSEIWSLEPGGVDQPGRLWAGTIPAAVFFSDDEGASWNLAEDLWNREERMHWFGGGKDDAGIHSVCVDPRDSRRVHVGISCGGVWYSTDAGQTWHAGGKGMRNEYMPPDRAYDNNTQDPHRLVQCPVTPDVLWVQHHNGIFRSTDAAQSWREIENVQPSAFGFAVAVHPHDAETAWFVPGVKDEKRVPVEGRLVVTKTTNGGQSFTQLADGLPSRHAYDLVYRHGLDVDATGERLAMGSTTGSLWISENGGTSWTCLSTHLPPIYAVRFV